MSLKMSKEVSIHLDGKDGKNEIEWFGERLLLEELMKCVSGQKTFNRF